MGIVTIGLSCFLLVGKFNRRYVRSPLMISICLCCIHFTSVGRIKLLDMNVIKFLKSCVISTLRSNSLPATLRCNSIAILLRGLYVVGIRWQQNISSLPSLCLCFRTSQVVPLSLCAVLHSFLYSLTVNHPLGASTFFTLGNCGN